MCQAPLMKIINPPTQDQGKKVNCNLYTSIFQYCYSHNTHELIIIIKHNKIWGRKWALISHQIVGTSIAPRFYCQQQESKESNSLAIIQPLKLVTQPHPSPYTSNGLVQWRNCMRHTSTHFNTSSIHGRTKPDIVPLEIYKALLG